MPDNLLLTSLADLQQLLKGSTTSQSLAILNNVMAETIGMSMHNAVTAQHNAQMLNSATTTSTCARILSVIGAHISPPPPAPTPSISIVPSPSGNSPAENSQSNNPAPIVSGTSTGSAASTTPVITTNSGNINTTSSTPSSNDSNAQNSEPGTVKPPAPVITNNPASSTANTQGNQPSPTSSGT